MRPARLSRFYICSFLAGGLLFSAPEVRAQDDFSERTERAVSCYATLDYDCVIELLAGISVEDAASESPPSVVQTAVRLLAVTYVIRGVPEQARTLFADLLRIFPSYTLEGDDLSPRFFRVFDEARAQSQAEPLAAAMGPRAEALAGRCRAANGGRADATWVADSTRDAAATMAEGHTEQGAGPAELRLGLGAGLHVLTGRDSEVFDNAFGISFRAGTEAVFGLWLGVAVDWASPTVVLTDLVEPLDGGLNTLDMVLDVGVPWRFGRLRLLLGGGVGYSAFGFEDTFERGGVALDVVFGLGVTIIRGLGLDFEARARTVITDGVSAPEVSNPLLFGLSLSYDVRFE